MQKGWYWHLDQGIKLVELVPNYKNGVQNLINKNNHISVKKILGIYIFKCGVFTIVFYIQPTI